MKPRRRKRPLAEINVVPYIDVMLVLLIIFMITAPLLSQGIKIDLPEVAAETLPADTKDPLVISIDKAGNYYMNYGDKQDRPVAAQTMVNRVAALLKHRQRLPVLVKGDRHVAYGHIAEVMALLQNAGVDRVSLVTDLPDNVMPEK